MAANTIVRYVRTDVQAGGTGETNNQTGTDRAYSRLAEAAADLDWNFTTNDDEVEIRCSAPTGVQDDSVPVFNGCVTSPTNRLKIIGNWSGESETTSEYIKTTSNNNGLYLAVGYIDIQNVQYYTEQDNYLIRIECSENSHILISHCLFHAHDTTNYGYSNISIANSSGYSHEVDIWNCTIHGSATSGQANRTGIHVYYTLLVLYNTILYDFYGYGVRYSSGSTCLLKNTVIHDVADSTSFSSFEAGSDYNAFDEGSAPGSNSIDTSSYAVTDIWTDPDNGDFSIADTDSPVYDAGTDLSTDPQGKISFTDDISGNTRAQWSMGSREFVIAGNSHDASFILSVGGSAGVQVTVPASVEITVEGAGTMLVISPAACELAVNAGSVRGDIRAAESSAAVSGAGVARLTTPAAFNLEVDMNTVRSDAKPVSHTVAPDFATTRSDTRPVSHSAGITGDGTVRLTIPATYEVSVNGSGTITATMPATFVLEIDIAAVISGSEGMVHAATFVLGVDGGAVRADIRPGQSELQAGFEGALTVVLPALHSVSIEGNADMRRVVPAEVTVGVSHDAVIRVVAEAAALLGIEFGVTVNQPIVVSEILSLISEISQLLGIASTFTVSIEADSPITTSIEEESFI